MFSVVVFRFGARCGRLLALCILVGCLAVIPARADGGAAWLERLQSAVRACGEYEVQFDLSTTDEQSVFGTYRVAGDRYFIALSEAWVYCDGTVRYEVSDRAREVVIDAVDTASHNLLDNPVRAFDFVGEQYDVRIVAEQPEWITLRLTPRTKGALSVIELTLDKGSALPISVIYGAEDMRIALKIASFGKSATPFPCFRKADFADYEWIDFR